MTYENVIIITNKSFNCVRFADGKYLFIESSFPRRENDIAMLESPTIIFGEDHSTACLSFWLVDFLRSRVTKYQRWSRGHKARGQGQGQGHKKNPRPRPRPRTALPRTEPLEAKDRNARGQGQGPRTQAQVFSKKKVFKNFFQAISNSLAYPEFIGISLNHKSNEMTSSKFFQRGSFCGINLS